MSNEIVAALIGIGTFTWIVSVIVDIHRAGAGKRKLDAWTRGTRDWKR